MTHDVDEGLFVLGKHPRHVVQNRLETRIDDRRIHVKRDVGRHVQQQLVAVPDNLDAAARSLFAQLFFLLVHIGTDGRARERADTGAD